jgi:hypothetical protein
MRNFEQVVIAAKAGFSTAELVIHLEFSSKRKRIPAFAGMTSKSGLQAFP